MAHADIENKTPFAFGFTLLADEVGQPLVVPLVQATYRLQGSGLGTLAEKQPPVSLPGELWGEPGKSSYKYEPQSAFTKLATDVVLIGHAHTLREYTRELTVRLRAGSLEKSVHVSGDRVWTKSFGISMTTPEPFEKVPLIYERAFGGWDRSNPDPAKHAFEPRNPVGKGFRSPHGRFEEDIHLPNLEDPRNLIREYGSIPGPAGFGFISPEWQPRARLAGTYDEQWMKQRMPLLAADFDRRSFNAASAGLVAPGYLRGNEAICIENASPRGTIRFNLPEVPAPECRMQLTGRRDAVVQTNLDTVIINTDEDLLILIWRGHHPVRNGPHEVVSIKVQAEGVSVPAAVR